MTQQDEQSLWDAFLSGDRQAYETIYRNYHAGLYEYGMRKLDNEELVKDCLQDLFVKLWQNRAGTGTTGNIRYYLMTALKNALINVRIKTDRYPTISFPAGEHFALRFSTAPEINNSDLLRRQSQQLLNALNQLTPRQKEVIYLRYFEDLSYEQIAALMDISVKGIYKLSYRALDALKAILGMSRPDLLALLLLLRHCHIE